MASQDRQELIRNAVTFLADPKAQSSSLAQRIQFLEAKGLTPPEIEEAMRQANRNLTAPGQPGHQYSSYANAPFYTSSPYGMPGPPQPWDWRDYFITAVLSGAVTYGVVSLFRKYVSPHLRPPSATAYEEDRDSLNAQFDVAEALLKEIQAETSAVRAVVEEQKDRVDRMTREVEVVVQGIKEGDSKTRDEMREIRDEVNNIREMLPKMIEKNKESQTQSLAELQQELKSLKALLLSRGSTSGSGFSTPTLPTKPSIPAWQLAGAGSIANSLNPAAMSPLPEASGLPVQFVTQSKGKELEVPQSSGSNATP